MLKPSSSAALLAAGATAAYLAGEAWPTRKVPLRVLALVLAGAAVYQTWRATVGRDGGGLVGLLGDLALGEDLPELVLQPSGVPRGAGGVEVGPGRVTLPDGTILDGITGDVLKLPPVSGRILQPLEGGRPDRALGHSDYELVVELRNNTSTTLRGPVHVAVAEDRTWPQSNAVLSFTSGTIELPQGETTIVRVRLETAGLNIWSIEATATVSFGGFVVGQVSYTIV